MQDFLYDTFDIEVSPHMITHTLEREKWSKKAHINHAAECSESLCAAWQEIQPLFSSNQLVFLGESASNERTGDRRKGWSPVGLICERLRPVKHSERWSILPVLSEDGYMDYLIHQGAITSELFIEFVREKVLPHCTPYPV